MTSRERSQAWEKVTIHGAYGYSFALNKSRVSTGFQPLFFFFQCTHSSSHFRTVGTRVSSAGGEAHLRLTDQHCYLPQHHPAWLSVQGVFHQCFSGTWELLFSSEGHFCFNLASGFKCVWFSPRNLGKLSNLTILFFQPPFYQSYFSVEWFFTTKKRGFSL